MRIVVKCGVTMLHISISSKPTTEISSGTLIPKMLNALYKVIAALSLEHTHAVGSLSNFEIIFATSL